MSSSSPPTFNPELQHSYSYLQTQFSATLHNMGKNTTSITLSEFVDLTKEGAAFESVVDALTRFVATVEPTDAADAGTAQSKKDTSERVFTFFQLDSKNYSSTKLVEIESLDGALTRHAHDIPSSLLVAIVGACFKNVSDNFSTILIATAELTRRNDVDGEKGVINAYYKATAYYDAGHRLFANTVQDQLIDTYFPQFSADALVLLLATDSMDFLSSDGGDMMDALFVPAFKGSSSASQETVTKLEAAFMNYLEHCILYYDATYIQELLDEVLPHMSQHLKEKVLARNEAVKRRGELKVTLEGNHDTATIEVLCMELGGTIMYEDFEFMKLAFNAAITEELSYEALEHYFTFYVASLTRDGTTNVFKNDTLLVALINKNFEKSLLLIREAAKKFYSTYPKSGAWRTSLDAALATVLRDEMVVIDSKRFNELLLLACDVTKQDKGQLVSTALTRLILDVVTTEKNDSPLFDALKTILEKKVYTIDIDTPQLVFTSTEAYMNMVQMVPYLDLPKEMTDRFYENFVTFILKNKDWKLFDTYLPLFSKEKHGMFVMEEVVSKVFAVVVGENIENEDTFSEECFERFKKLQLTPEEHERVLAQFIGLAVNNNDTEKLDTLIARIPKVITWDILAYNMACYYAHKKDKKNLLKMAKRSIELEKESYQFMKDPDFEEYKTDPEFLEVIKDPENPYKAGDEDEDDDEDPTAKKYADDDDF